MILKIFLLVGLMALTNGQIITREEILSYNQANPVCPYPDCDYIDLVTCVVPCVYCPCAPPPSGPEETFTTTTTPPPTTTTDCGLPCCILPECQFGIDSGNCTTCPCPCLPSRPTTPPPTTTTDCGLPCCILPECQFGIDSENCTTCPCPCLPRRPKRLKCRKLK